MQRQNLREERLVVPNDFTSPAGTRNVQKDLVPPSHFTSSSSGPQRGVQIPGPTPPVSWINPGSDPLSPWMAFSQAQQEILELRKENLRMVMLQEDRIRRQRLPVDPPSDLRNAERSEPWESKWRLEAEKQKEKAERLKMQVETLQDAAERHGEDMRGKDGTVNRQSRELESVREELCEAKTELSAQKEEISSQLERLKEQSEEITKLRGDLERSREAELGRLQAEGGLSEQLEQMQQKHELELQQLNASQRLDLGAARKANDELQDRLQSVSGEVLQLQSSLTEASAERDGLKEHLSQMGQAFETQSATLHSLRNYIGQLAPEKGETERLNDTVERLNKEKAALQTTTELLTVRLNSVNEIVALQEEKMTKKTSTDSLMKDGAQGLQVLQLWREKVFKLCVQLRSKDIELRREKDELQTKIRAMEQQMEQEQHRGSVLQHSLDDRIAELDLQKVEKGTLRQNLVQVQKENSQLKSQNLKAEAEVKALTAAVQRFSLAFENKMAEVDAAETRLNTLTQRLTFANGRVETIQGLVMRRAALHKVQRATKQTEQAADGITKLQTELRLVREERDKLTQELKRTPELIDKTLAHLKEQHETKLRQQQQQLEQSRAQVRQAVGGREEAEQSLQEARAQLEESRVLSQRALQERVSELEDCCAQKLREMEVEVDTVRREHSKAVLTLRRFERAAAKRQDETSGQRDVHNKQLAAVAERRFMRQSAAQPAEPSETRLPAEERLLSVLQELQSLSAAVVNSSEDSAEEEEGEDDGVGPSTGSSAS